MSNRFQSQILGTNGFIFSLTIPPLPSPTLPDGDLLPEQINAAEQFLSDFLRENLGTSDVLDLPVIILPKFSKAKTQWIGLLMTETLPDDFDSVDNSYDIIIRLGVNRETLFDDRNKVIALFNSIERRLTDWARYTQNIDVFRFDRSESIRYSIDDDFYDIIFSINVLM